MHSSLANMLLLILFFIFPFRSLSISSSNSTNDLDGKILNVGQELWKERLPLQMGARLYHLRGLKSQTWYEVKISYPASIPSSFSIQLKRGESEFGLNRNRRLLNTEKIIFTSGDFNVHEDRDGFSVLVTVEPEGIVAIPHSKERECVIFNIVCEELLLGIPHRACWVVIVALVCLGLAFVVPFCLPPSLLSRNPRCMRPADHIPSKDT